MLIVFACSKRNYIQQFCLFFLICNKGKLTNYFFKSAITDPNEFNPYVQVDAVCPVSSQNPNPATNTSEEVSLTTDDIV